MEKPYKGKLEHWKAEHFTPELVPESLGYVIYGFLDGRFGKLRRTSAVVKHDKINRTIETLNSRYDLGEPAKETNNA